MKEPVKLRVFFGLQIHSKFHRLKDIISLMESSDNVLRQQHDILLEVEYGKFPPGKIPWTEVNEAINRADIGIFDISENNSNVMIEAGFALGLGRQVFLLKNKKSRSKYQTPSDIPWIYIPYRDKNSLNSPATQKELIEAIQDYVKKSHRSEYLFRNVWGFAENDEVTVICSELDKPQSRMFPEPKEYIYLSKYGDVDALLTVLITLHRLYRNLKVTYCTGDEVSDRGISYTGNIVLIGGPDYNAATRLFQKAAPYLYKRGPSESDIYLKERFSKTKYYPKFAHKKRNREILDYGFFVKIQNPFNDTKKVIMIGGPHTYGVYGAAKAFSYEGGTHKGIQYNNCKIVTENVGSDPRFSVIFKVEGIDENVQVPQIDPKKVKALPTK